MSTIEETVQPAVSDYPTDSPFEAELEAAHKLFLEELASTEGWEDFGETNEVQLHRKADPDDAYAVPTVRGECVVKDCTSDDFLSILQLPGLRKRWDLRFDSGIMVRRFNRFTYEFYTTMLGMGWIVWPRDIIGIQKNYKSLELNQEVVVVQASVTDDEHGPEQSGKTRATVTVSGWQLLPQGSDLKVTYIVKISLNGSIPLAMVQKVAVEIPLCTGRARDIYYELGHAPYVIPHDGKEPSVVFQTEHMSGPDSWGGVGPLEYRCAFTTSADGIFDIKTDVKKFYKDGVEAAIEGDGGAEVSVDDATGLVTVKCTEAGKFNTVVLTRKE
ncbi:BQ5605_C002g01221 [Microbotryum silenes-dioicae]|uniref:BQ5605_C002g01221 protein n=1 Tax=Microbotryum silenes-dioicae TaxID=796604 RepID=A0A2X0M219_9BASI|nr:BQ5605_C002g01221 [Microbotryum silenes-dioicae]